MASYTSLDIAGALRSAKNPNAALKNFLKHELRSGDPAERFVKDLRTAVGVKRTEALDRLVQQGFERFEKYLLAILRYAYLEGLSAIADPVVTRYAEDFNKTYERTDGKIVIKDEAAFRKIFSEVQGLFEKGLAEQNLGPAGLMKSVLTTFVFDPDVVAEVDRLAARG